MTLLLCLHACKCVSVCVFVGGWVYVCAHTGVYARAVEARDLHQVSPQSFCLGLSLWWLIFIELRIIWKLDL